MGMDKKIFDKDQEAFDKEQAKLGIAPLQSPNKDFNISINVHMPELKINDKYEETDMKDLKQAVKDAADSNGIGITQDKDHW